MSFCKYFLLVFFINCLFNPSMCQDFEVAPVILNFDANPGEIQEKSIHVKNYGNKVQSFQASLFDFKVENGKRIKQKAGSNSRSLEPVLTMSPLGKTTVNPEITVRIVPYLTAIVPDADVDAIPPKAASAPGSIGKKTPSSLKYSFNCFRVTFA